VGLFSKEKIKGVVNKKGKYKKEKKHIIRNKMKQVIS